MSAQDDKDEIMWGSKANRGRCLLCGIGHGAHSDDCPTIDRAPKGYRAARNVMPVKPDAPSAEAVIAESRGLGDTRQSAPSAGVSRADYERVVAERDAAVAKLTRIGKVNAGGGQDPAFLLAEYEEHMNVVSGEWHQRELALTAERDQLRDALDFIICETQVGDERIEAIAERALAGQPVTHEWLATLDREGKVKG